MFVFFFVFVFNDSWSNKFGKHCMWKSQACLQLLVYWFLDMYKVSFLQIGVSVFSSLQVTILGNGFLYRLTTMWRKERRSTWFILPKSSCCCALDVSVSGSLCGQWTWSAAAQPALIWSPTLILSTVIHLTPPGLDIHVFFVWNVLFKTKICLKGNDWVHKMIQFTKWREFRCEIILHARRMNVIGAKSCAVENIPLLSSS